jgi:L-seryl-tRNA(Ser) seleniumtransferase
LTRDRFGNAYADGLPYARGALLRGADDDFAKLRAAWRIIESRTADGGVFNFTGLERSLDLGDAPVALLDDDLAGARWFDRLTELALDHLGGVPGRDEVFVANRLTAAVVAAMQVLVGEGAIVVGVSAGYSHPCIARAVRLARGDLVDTVGRAAFEERVAAADVVVLTRLAVTYDALPTEDLGPIVAAAHARGAPVFVDDAGGARVGPAVLGQPKTLELAAEVGATGLDKYGTAGPRLGLLAGRADLVRRIRARATELGVEARPMLYPAVVRSLERYRPERVRELVAATNAVGDALGARLGRWVTRTPVAVRLEGEDVLAEALRRAAVDEPPVVPLEATAALAMVLLRDHGVLTVHFAALPPGTAGLLVKFVPPETLDRFGGADAFAAAVDASLDEVARLLTRPAELRALLAVDPAAAPPDRHP